MIEFACGFVVGMAVWILIGYVAARRSPAPKLDQQQLQELTSKIVEALTQRAQT